jgi:hypothetical protein
MKYAFALYGNSTSITSFPVLFWPSLENQNKVQNIFNEAENICELTMINELQSVKNLFEK